MRAKTTARLLATIATLILLAPLAAADEATYVVRKGDTLYSISRRFEVPISELLKANGLREGAPIIEGRKLVIPSGSFGVLPASPVPAAAPSPPPAAASPLPPAPPRHAPHPGSPAPPGSRIHVAKAGETFYRIARTYGITVDELLKANGIPKNGVLKAGQRLAIPGTAVVRNATAKPARDPEPTPGPASRGSATTTWPIAGQRSYMTGKLYGVEIKGKEGDTVRAVASGKVLSAGPYRGFGQIVVVTRNDKYIYIYGGNDKIYVKAGEDVRPGTALGELGVDPKEGRPVMYFMAFRNGKAQDPARCPRD